MGCLVLLIVATLTLVNGDPQTFFEQAMPKKEAEFAKQYLAFFPVREFDTIEAHIPPDLQNAQLRSQLEHIAATFPSENPTAIQPLGVRWRWKGGIHQIELAFQYAYPGEWLLANVTLQQHDPDPFVTSVQVHRLPDSLERINRFTFDGKGSTHVAILAWAMLAPLITGVALLRCYKTPIPKRKWLWVLFILCGIGQVTLNWTEGTLTMNPLAVQFFGAGVSRPGLYAPWLLTVSFPLGALLFFLRKKTLPYSPQASLATVPKSVETV